MHDLATITDMSQTYILCHSVTQDVKAEASGSRNTVNPLQHITSVLPIHPDLQVLSIIRRVNTAHNANLCLQPVIGTYGLFVFTCSH